MTSIEATDVDGDGLEDAVVAAQYTSGSNGDYAFGGTVMVYKGAAGLSGPKNPTYNYHATSGVAGGILTSGDIDFDGYGDILLKRYESTSNSVHLLSGRSAATWSTASNVATFSSANGFLPVSGNFGNEWNNEASLTTVADVNADGKLDLVASFAQTSPVRAGTTYTNVGKVCLCLNRSQANWACLNAITGADFCVIGADANDYFGSTVTVGNFDTTTSRLEIIVSAPQADGSNELTSKAGKIAVISLVLPANYQRPLVFDLENDF